MARTRIVDQPAYLLSVHELSHLVSILDSFRTISIEHAFQFLPAAPNTIQSPN